MDINNVEELALEQDWYKQVLSQQSLVAILEEFSDKLRRGDLSDERYKNIRKLLIRIPVIEAQLPYAIRHARTVSAICEIGGYYEPDGRSLFCTRELDPLIYALEKHANDHWLENHEFIEPLGEGGFGVVKRFHHKILNADFAVKFYNPTPLGDSRDAYARFFQEASMLFELRHSSIIRFYDAGMVPGGIPFIKMEFFKGYTLAEAIRAYSTPNTQKTLNIVSKLTSAIEHAHSKNIIHRDICPRNIMVAKSKEPTLIDFGLGKYIDEKITKITRTGYEVDSGSYMAPELREDPLLTSKTADIYSLGGVWFYCLIGRDPSGAINIQQTLRKVPELEKKYQQIIEKCLANNPDDRFTCAAEILEAINKKNNLINIGSGNSLLGANNEKAEKLQIKLEKANSYSLFEAASKAYHAGDSNLILKFTVSNLYHLLLQAINEDLERIPNLESVTNILGLWEHKDSYENIFELSSIVVMDTSQSWFAVENTDSIRRLLKQVCNSYCDQRLENTGMVKMKTHWVNGFPNTHLKIPPPSIADAITSEPTGFMLEPDTIVNLSIDYDSIPF